MTQDIVTETIKYWRQSQFEWGKRDCLLSVADYLVSLGYADYGVPFRDKYQDEDGAKRMIAEAGGELEIMRRPQFSVTSTPKRGDIALVQMPAHSIAAICTGQGVAMRLLRGACEIDMRFISFIEIWSVPPCRQSVPF